MSYVDKYGLYNNKEVIDGNPSGNDGPILTSYAEKLGLPITWVDIQRYYNSLHKVNNIPVERLPGKATPYPSRDSILGWYWLGLLSVDDLIKNNWSFSPLPIPKFNLVQFICQSILCLYEHRNYFWKHEFTQMYRMAFSVPIQDRAYMLRDSGRDVPLHYRVYEWVSNKLTSKSISSKLIAWRKGLIEIDDEIKQELKFYEE